MVEGGPALFREAVGRGEARGLPRPATSWRGLVEAETGARADSRWRCGSELNAHPDDLSFAIGEEQFNRRLHHEHALQAGAPELYRYGLHLVEEVEAEVTALAQEIEPSTPWRILVERLRGRLVPGSDLVNVFREETEQGPRSSWPSGAWCAIPDGDLEVVDTPRFLRPLVPFAAYEAPGALAADRSGMFYVTSPNGARSSEGMHCMHEVAATAIHEAYPGSPSPDAHRAGAAVAGSARCSGPRSPWRAGRSTARS